MTKQNNFLEIGTRLMVSVNSTTKDEKLCSYLYTDLEILKANGKPFVELVLTENLYLNLNTDHLHDCTCFIPALQKFAKSVNHAATQISEAFELSRKSHTKDVFREAYFQDTDQAWKCLDNWRKKVRVSSYETKNISKLITKLKQNVNNPHDFNIILELINLSKEMAKAIVNLQEESHSDKDIKVQKILNTLVAVGKLKEILKIWKNNQSNSNELFWHKLLEENSFVLAQIFSTPVTILHSEAYVGGKGIENTGGSIIDFLFVNKLTRNISLIEIKTPTCHLLGKEYRDGIYNPSPELSGAVMQVSTSRDSLIKEYDRLVNQSNSYFDIFNPLSIVIAGHAENELSDSEKKRSFEIFRHNHINVQIVTYDEVFEKIKNLVEILEGSARN
ncbi:DUF4263 domain-containing protein [Calothrix membranacea FACHB-236]|nr:DUF4263 domain-containing protein [Calothrix membranacea FACHB-236]